MTYGAEARPARKALDRKLDITKIKIIKRICGVTKMVKVRRREQHNQRKNEGGGNMKEDKRNNTIVM